VECERFDDLDRSEPLAGQIGRWAEDPSENARDNKVLLEPTQGHVDNQSEIRPERQQPDRCERRGHHPSNGFIYPAGNQQRIEAEAEKSGCKYQHENPASRTVASRDDVQYQQPGHDKETRPMPVLGSADDAGEPSSRLADNIDERFQAVPTPASAVDLPAADAAGPARRCRGLANTICTSPM